MTSDVRAEEQEAKDDLPGKQKTKKQAPAKESQADSIRSEESPSQQTQRRPRVELDESQAVTAYANFCRVTGTPEEMIIDFGLNSQPFGAPTEPIVIRQRLVTNYYTAKRLLHTLTLSVQRHEQAFGVLETDVNKRVVGGDR